MNVSTLESKLRELDFYIVGVQAIDYGQQIRLGCGAVINVYDKGTVLVQGKLHPQCRDESMRLLKQILSLYTRWCVK